MNTKQLEEKVNNLELQLKAIQGLKDNGRRHYTAEEFKKAFKVGDSISGWSTGKVVTITAIGESSFLCKSKYYSEKEQKCSFTATTWIKVTK